VHRVIDRSCDRVAGVASRRPLYVQWPRPPSLSDT
jgi:hypothetical protein